MGKSTLLNAIIGEKLSIITSKPQTTRHRILAIYNDDEHQIVFSDTPGIIYEPHYKLQKAMNTFVNTSFEDADGLLFVTDVFDDMKYNEQFLERLKKAGVPKFLIINKIDLGDQQKVNNLIRRWHEITDFYDTIAISAKLGFNTDTLIEKIKSILPVSPPYYPKDQFTDKTERFFIEEIIREKILLLYKQEVPYSVEVAVQEWKEMIKNGKPFVKISAYIYVARKSQKQILIGKNGEKIKRLGIEARKDIEAFLGKNVYLELYVKVLDNWRDDDTKLKKLGY